MADSAEPTPVCSTPSHDGRAASQLSLPRSAHSRTSSRQTEESSISQATATTIPPAIVADESDSGSDDDERVAPQNRDMRKFWANMRRTWDDLAPGQRQFVQAVVAAVRNMPVSGAALHLRAAPRASHFQTGTTLPYIQLAASSRDGKTVTGQDFAHQQFWYRVKRNQSEIFEWQPPTQQQTAELVFGGNARSPCALHEHLPSRRQAPNSLSRRDGQFECSVRTNYFIKSQLLNLA
jgi:hypothetical protein